ncbi:unnamed protein product [Tenebrio molitor]|nr:unnamed protein product [Tenebrio molitor]
MGILYTSHGYTREGVDSRSAPIIRFFAATSFSIPISILLLYFVLINFFQFC